MNTKLIATLTGVGGAIIGMAAGYVLAVKHLEDKYITIGAQELEEAKSYYRDEYKALYKKDEFSSPRHAAQALIPGVEFTDDVSNKDLERIVKGLKKDISEEKNVFSNVRDISDDEEWDSYKASRSSNAPYILEYNEFMDGEVGYDQSTLTYYAGDLTLCNEQEIPIEDVDNIVGLGNLDRFGYQSGDKNVVYIRNEVVEMDFEVIFREGSYAKEVAGFEEEEALPKPRVKKLRKEE